MKRALPAIASVILAACAPEPTAIPSPPPAATAAPLLELPDLEVRADGRDRFATCSNVPRSSVKPDVALPKPPVTDAGPSPEHVANAERTIADLRKPFRECYQAGLRHGSTSIARVVWQIDIAPDVSMKIRFEE